MGQKATKTRSKPRLNPTKTLKGKKDSHLYINIKGY